MSQSDEPFIIVSCDAHAGAPVETYKDYLDPDYRSLMPQLIAEEKHMLAGQAFLEDPGRLINMDPRQRITTGGLASGWDRKRRLEEMDAEGFAAEIVYPGVGQALTPFFYQFNRPYPADVRAAGIRAYHRWLVDMIGPAKDRLIGTAVPCLDMDEAIKEITFCAEQGFRSAFVPGQTEPDAPSLLDPQHERYWAACNDLGLTLTIHAGWGTRQGVFNAFFDEVHKLMKIKEESGETPVFSELATQAMNMMNAENPDSVMFFDIGQRQAFWRMIFSGVFDRYPKLKLVIAECRGDWAPALKAHMDERYLAAGKRRNLKRKPSEYFGENVFISPSSPRPNEVKIRHEIGLKNFLFGSDFPHVEGTWPNTLEWLRATFSHVPENELRLILGENAIDVYGLDKKVLSGVAAKIGFKPSEIIGDYKVDEKLIADFEYRSQFSHESPPIADQLLDSKLDSDLAAA